jgi:hypothetical protein
VVKINAFVSLRVIRGLPANLQEGLATLNPGLIRQSYLMRWYDSTANALKDGYRNQTRQLFPAPNIRDLDHTQLQPGDLAATADGVHILAYLGNQTWIEAAPGAKVRTLKPTDPSDWLTTPVVLLRWQTLETRYGVR